MSRSGQVALPLILVCTAFVGLGGYFLVRPSIIESSASESCSLTSPLSFEEVRTRLVRGNLTPTLVEAAGCQIVEMEVLDRQIDVSTDPHPLINALKRRSKSTVTQTQSLIVEMPDDELETTRLHLMQSAEIAAKQFTITVTLEEPAGILADYAYVVHGVPDGDGTKFSFSMDVTVKKKITGVAHPWVPAKVVEGAHAALERQSTAFVQAIHELE